MLVKWSTLIFRLRRGAIFRRRYGITWKSWKQRLHSGARADNAQFLELTLLWLVATHRGNLRSSYLLCYSAELRRVAPAEASLQTVVGYSEMPRRIPAKRATRCFLLKPLWLVVGRLPGEVLKSSLSTASPCGASRNTTANGMSGTRTCPVGFQQRATRCFLLKTLWLVVGRLPGEVLNDRSPA